MDMTTITILIVIFGLLFDYTNGFHDAATVVSTTIATKALKPIIAILLAAVLNTVGATQISGVAETIANGLVEKSAVTQEIVLSAVLGAIIWNFFTWYFGLPSSSSYALIGGLLGASILKRGDGIVLWGGVLHKVLIPMILSPFIGFGIAYLMMKILSYFVRKRDSKHNTKIFRCLQIGSGSLVALSHGLNDAQKSMGIITLGLFSSGFLTSIHIPFWVILSCAFMMGAGTASGGYRIIHTVGTKITHLSMDQGFIAEMSASFVILTTSFLGMPISSSQMIVGSVGGVGAVKGFKEVEWKIIGRLALAWICTLPGAAIISSITLLTMEFFKV
jgi:PiT family inorganic phosphate transporter